MPGDIPIPDSSTEQLENCNGDVHVATNAIKAATPETAFWIRHIRSVMEPLLASTQSYTPSEQTAHLKFLDNYVAPALGSLPTEPHSKYTTPASFVGTLFEPSLNFSNKASTKARFSIDIIAPVGREGLDPFGEKKARDTLRQWASTLDADTTWLEHFVSSLQLTPGETEIVRRKIPAHINHPPACSIGCELNGASRTLKAYIPIKRKALAAGKASSSVLIDALESLETSGPDYSVSGLSTLAS
jgi:DMATS type aromatic prenyltransferase